MEVHGFRLKRGEVDCCRACRPSFNPPVVGVKYGKITVIEVLGIGRDLGLRSRGRIVRGQCECGGYWTGPIDSLRRGNTRSCGCLPTGKIPNPNKEGVAVRHVLCGYKRHAARRGLSWELSDQEFYALIRGTCFYCGSPPSNVAHSDRNRDGGKPRKTVSRVVYSGIDRKDNDLGYTTANSVSCCATCNYGKRGLTTEAFLAHMKAIHDQHFGASSHLQRLQGDPRAPVAISSCTTMQCSFSSTATAQFPCVRPTPSSSIATPVKPK